MAVVPSVDLNLFRLLATLYDERSVSRTAERLFLTPSAVSHALRRLRLMLDDELFVRGPGGMVPTTRAHEIAGQLRLLLPQLNDVISPPKFEPAATTRIFSIACVPYLSSVWVPHLAHDIATAAPRARLDVKMLGHNIVDDLSSGAVDVALGGFRRMPPRIIAEEVLRDSYVWVLRRSNPLARRRPTLKALSQIPHVDILLSGVANPQESYDLRQGLERLVAQNSVVATEQAFAEAGLPRTVLSRAPDSIAAVMIAARADAACNVPLRVARKFAPMLDLAIFDPPYRSAPLMIQMLYHADFAERPALRWLLERIRATRDELEEAGDLPVASAAVPPLSSPTD